MGSRREEERNEKIIRGLMKLPPNRKCINCNSVGPQYVCTNFWTFTCLSCSGIHREFTHRVKSVSMAKFTTQEVRSLEQGGNQRARDIYLKDWDWQRMRLPDNSKPDRIREFIRAVYVDKKYAGGKSTNKPATDGESVKKRPVPSAVNRQTGASSVAHSTQPNALQRSTNSPASQIAPTQGSVQHLPVSVQPQPMAFSDHDLFDTSTMPQPGASSASIDLFAGFNQHTASISSGHSDVNGSSHKVVVQKVVTPSSSVPAGAVPTSHPVQQDLFSLSILQEPSTSSSPASVDLFAGFDQQLAPMSTAHHITPAAPLPANEGWAFFDAPQYGTSTSFSNAQAQVPAALPPSDGITKTIDHSTLPTSPPNGIITQTSPPIMDQWSLNAEEVKIPVSKENSQVWNAFGESTGNMPDNLFAFNTMPQVPPHQFTAPGVPYVGSGTPQDLVRGEPERSTPGDMFPGFNVSPGVLGEPSFPAPIQHQLGTMSQAAKSTNPFDMAFESDIESNDMFMDLTSLQASLPDPHVPAEYSGDLAESWISQNLTVPMTMPYIPSAPQGGLVYIPGQVQEPHMLNSTQQGHFPSRNPFE
uniref:Uncharacterized protein n=1 Tax=Avena sativa TaxID=4498 RepID=A0ACD5WHC1_AVESA